MVTVGIVPPRMPNRPKGQAAEVIEVDCGLSEGASRRAKGMLGTDSGIEMAMIRACFPPPMKTEERAGSSGLKKPSAAIDAFSSLSPTHGTGRPFHEKRDCPPNCFFYLHVGGQAVS